MLDLCDSNIILSITRQHKSRGMLDFQNRALDIKLLKFYTNRDNQAYLKNAILMEDCFPNLRSSLDSCCQNKFGSGLGS